jgi:hypothetical protein
MPHFGQAPGFERTISGCIGQTYSVRAAGGAAVTGSSAMPHFGHWPGESVRISGCIGQVYVIALFPFPLQKGTQRAWEQVRLSSFAVLPKQGIHVGVAAERDALSARACM